MVSAVTEQCSSLPHCTARAVLKLAVICGVINLLILFPLNAATDITAKTSFSTGWIRSGEKDVWFTGAAAKLDFSTIPSSKVKAYISLSYNYIGAGSGYLHTVALDKAYFKMRLPWIHGSFARLSAGKQPISWGYGLYFNAADSIFGSEPTGTGTGGMTTANLDSLRALTDWMITAYIPLGNSVFAELVVLPPTASTARTGGRVSVNAAWGFLENAEFSYLVSFPETAGNGFSGIWTIGSGSDNLPGNLINTGKAGITDSGAFSEHTIAAAFDGTIYVDWTLCASGTIAAGADFYKTIALSASIVKNWNIPSDTREVPFSVRAEMLYYPARQKFSSFVFTSVGITDTVSASALCLSTVQTDSAAVRTDAGLTLLWQPIAGLELSVSGMTDFTLKTASCSVSGSYKF